MNVTFLEASGSEEFNAPLKNTLDPLTSFWAPLIPLIHLIFTWLAWFSVGQFASMYGTFLETTESDEYNLAHKNHLGPP